MVPIIMDVGHNSMDLSHNLEFIYGDGLLGIVKPLEATGRYCPCGAVLHKAQRSFRNRLGLHFSFWVGGKFVDKSIFFVLLA